MKEDFGNPVLDKSYNFAIRIIKLCKQLQKQKEFNFADQLWRSGTSIGANAQEAMGGHSKKDFLAKLTISYKEARETMYWLKLLVDTETVCEEIVLPLQKDCDELLRIIGAIQKSTKANL